ncbi:transglycosylase SLT domain-containing protein [Aurantivibrio infirmus]
MSGNLNLKKPILVVSCVSRNRPGFRFLSFLVIIFLLSACASSPPRTMNNLCQIFEEKKHWYKAAKSANDNWGASIPVMMAFIHQESRFKAKAKPPRRKILWIIPGPRVSSAYGYSQAKSTTWDWYKDSSGNRWVSRDNFGDAIDFIGWYNAQSKKQNNIAANDAYNLYLAYHEGHGGFRRKTYNKKAWLKTVANKVSGRANSYALQLQSCEKKLDKTGWWPF